MFESNIQEAKGYFKQKPYHFLYVWGICFFIFLVVNGNFIKLSFLDQLLWSLGISIVVAIIFELGFKAGIDNK